LPAAEQHHHRCARLRRPMRVHLFLRIFLVVIGFLLLSGIIGARVFVLQCGCQGF
jgi:hypothetical protein